MNTIVTRADDNIREMTDLTFPRMRKYAEKCGCDFHVLSHEPPVMTEDNRPHYRITKVREMLLDYDRVLCLDADMLINNDCPNIFDLVPEDMVGTIYEDKGSRQANRRRRLMDLQSAWGDVGWREGYTNAGTFLVSRMHRDIFLPHNGEYFLGWGSADLHMAYNIHKYGFKVFELDFRWNHMTMFSEPWNGADRFDSYIIHYAGKGIFDCNNKLEQIKNDLERLENGIH
jgi:hypothetical protein